MPRPSAKLLPSCPGSRRSLAALALLLSFWFLAFAGRIPDERGFRIRHVTDERILVDDVTQSESHISPPDSCHFSGDRIQDETVIRYRVIWVDSVQVAVFIDSADGSIIGAIQNFGLRAPGPHVTIFNGCLSGTGGGRQLSDGFYNIVVRAIDDTGRVEDTFLPLEIDRRSPVVTRLEETTGAPSFRNGDTIVFELETDRPNYSFNASTMFRLIDNDTTRSDELTTISDHGDGRYTIRHEISDRNTLPDQADILIPIDIRDEAGNLRRDRSQRLCLLNHPPALVSSRSLSGTNVFRNGETIRIETIWDSPNGPLDVTGDFANIDSDYDPARLTVIEREGNVYELNYQISTTNTKPAYPDYRIRITADDQACGSAIDTSIVLGLDNQAPPKPVHDPVPSTTRAPSLLIQGSAPQAASVEISRGGALLATAVPGPDARFAAEVTLAARSNTIILEALDAIGNRSPQDTIRVTRDAPAAPVLDPVPATTPDATVTITGDAPGAVRIDVKRGSTVIDTAGVDQAGGFRAEGVPLVSGGNNLTVEAVNNVGTASNPAAVTVFRIQSTFVSIPARFVPGTGSNASRIEVGLLEAGRGVRVELWSLAGDLLSVLEDIQEKDLYSFLWNGQDSGGRPVSGGPVLCRIEIDFADGSEETQSRAFMLVAPE